MGLESKEPQVMELRLLADISLTLRQATNDGS